MLFHFSILISVDCWQIMSLFLGNAHIGSSVMRLLVFENIEKAVGYMRHHAYCHRMDVARTQQLHVSNRIQATSSCTIPFLHWLGKAVLNELIRPKRPCFL